MGKYFSEHQLNSFRLEVRPFNLTARSVVVVDGNGLGYAGATFEYEEAEAFEAAVNNYNKIIYKLSERQAQLETQIAELEKADISRYSCSDLLDELQRRGEELRKSMSTADYEALLRNNICCDGRMEG